ncbi:acyltransferase family protein [Methylobacterium sp. HMF5984]|jgi:peptidoglycan/LPS O-acetylase OafA/YrhL|uniref:acyltransferase family protein n=1 Tax=unclassified Methylobacterium TaxID=2615210 RepID=UPI001FBA515E|nr:acyltransferase [Methylobacterium sp. E-041]
MSIDSGNTPVRPIGRIRSIDALRGLAATMVMLHHYLFSYEGRIGPHVDRVPSFAAGHFGVELFFILSGFVIAGTLGRTPSLGDYAVRRVARLYPAFLVCSGVTLGIFALGGPNPVGITPGAALAGLTMLSSLIRVPPIDPSHWTLTYEVAFYALAALALIHRGPATDPGLRLERICAGWLAAAFVGTLVLPVRTLQVVVLLNLPFALLFVIGAMLARLAAGALTPLGLGALAAAFGFTALGPAVDHGGVGTGLYVLLVLGFAGTVLAAATGRLPWLGCAPLVFLGAISYPLYLVHQILGYAIIRALEAGGWSSGSAILAAVLASVGLATVIRYAVETPGQRAIRRAFDRTRSSVPDTAEPARS